MAKRYKQLNTKFAEELVKQIPSNVYCAYILKVPVTAIANKRYGMKDVAVKAGSYHLSEKTKKRFSKQMKEIRKKYLSVNETKAVIIAGDVSPIPSPSIHLNKDVEDIIIHINGVRLSVKYGDKFQINGDEIYRLQRCY